PFLPMLQDDENNNRDDRDTRQRQRGTLNPAKPTVTASDVRQVAARDAEKCGQQEDEDLNNQQSAARLHNQTPPVLPHHRRTPSSSRQRGPTPGCHSPAAREPPSIRPGSAGNAGTLPAWGAAVRPQRVLFCRVSLSRVISSVARVASILSRRVGSTVSSR